MTTPLWDRWANLADREALGERLSLRERREKTQLERQHLPCAEEARIYSVLEQALAKAPSSAPVSDRLIQVALVANRSGEIGLPSARRHRPVSWIAAAALVLGVAVGIGFWVGEDSAGLDSASTLRASSARGSANSSVPGRGRLELSSGDVRLNGEPVQSGTVLIEGARLETRSGHVCLALPRGVTTCAGAETELELRSLGDRQDLFVASGHVAATLDQQFDGTSFSVSTPRGKFTAVGTIFGVRVARSGETSLRVEHGAVVVQMGARRQLVSESQAFDWDSESPRVLDAAASQEDLDLLSAAQLWASSSSNRLVLETSPSGAQVWLDEVVLGRSPLSVTVPGGSHDLRVELSGYAPITKTLRFRGEPVHEQLALTTDPGVDSETSSVTPESSSEDSSLRVGKATPFEVPPAALLQQASDARSQGRYAQAAKTYRRLRAQFPNSPEAQTALLSLAELQLSQLGQAREALAAYDAYLRTGGRLAREAHYGRIRALRALGDTTRELEAIQRFLERYPSSAYASSLRKRQESL